MTGPYVVDDRLAPRRPYRQHAAVGGVRRMELEPGDPEAAPVAEAVRDPVDGRHDPYRIRFAAVRPEARHLVRGDAARVVAVAADEPEPGPRRAVASAAATVDDREPGRRMLTRGRLRRRAVPVVGGDQVAADQEVTLAGQRVPEPAVPVQPRLHPSLGVD